MTYDDVAITDKGDIELILQGIAKEERCIRDLLNKHSARLVKDKIYRDQEELLSKVLHLKKRLQQEGFCLALPFGIGDTVYVLYERDGFYGYTSDKILRFRVENNVLGVRTVFFAVDNQGLFELKDIGKTVFRFESGASKRCSDLNGQEP